MRKWFFSILLAYSVCVFAEDVQVYKLQPTPVNDQSRVKITSNRGIRKSDPLYLQVESFPIGVSTQSEYFRESKFRESARGSTILLIFNGQTRRIVTTDDNNPYIEQRSYFNKRFRKKIDPALMREVEKNDFVVFAILVNSYGESVKIPNSSDTRILHYQTREKATPEMKEKMKQRAVYYNEPRGSFIEGQPILLDFYLENTRLSSSSDQVVLYIDGSPRAYLTDWCPYSIRNLPKGKHEVRLELINSGGKAYKAPFGDQKATIEVN